MLVKVSGSTIQELALTVVQVGDKCKMTCLRVKVDMESSGRAIAKWEDEYPGPGMMKVRAAFVG